MEPARAVRPAAPRSWDGMIDAVADRVMARSYLYDGRADFEAGVAAATAALREALAVNVHESRNES